MYFSTIYLFFVTYYFHFAYWQAVFQFLIAFSKRLNNTIDMFQNDAPGLTWHHLVRSAMEKMGGEARLTDLYSYLAEHPKSKKNDHYKERIRATIYEHKEQYIQTDSGAYRLTYKVA